MPCIICGYFRSVSDLQRRHVRSQTVQQHDAASNIAQQMPAKPLCASSGAVRRSGARCGISAARSTRHGSGVQPPWRPPPALGPLHEFAAGLVRLIGICGRNSVLRLQISLYMRTAGECSVQKLRSLRALKLSLVHHLNLPDHARLIWRRRPTTSAGASWLRRPATFGVR